MSRATAMPALPAASVMHVIISGTVDLTVLLALMAEPVVQRERCRMTGTLSDMTKKIKPEPTAHVAAARVSAAPRPTPSAGKFAPLIQHACKACQGVVPTAAGLRQVGSAAATSAPGPRTTASPSATAAGSGQHGRAVARR